MKARIALLIFLSASVGCCSANAFQIDLPKHYHEDLEAKRTREAELLWLELDRTAIQSAITQFISEHPLLDGVDLGRSRGVDWSRDGRQLACGPWSLFLAEWEMNYPSLQQIKWSKSKLVASLAYDWETKTVRSDGNAEIRLIFQLNREGPLFSKKRISAHYERFDYGEVYLMLPFGGVELRRANKSLQPTPTAVMPPAAQEITPAVGVAEH
jgi:hypothetical protein